MNKNTILVLALFAIILSCSAKLYLEDLEEVEEEQEMELYTTKGGSSKGKTSAGKSTKNSGSKGKASSGK